MPTDNTGSIDSVLAAARDAYERHAWTAAYDGLAAVDREGLLGPADLERLATAAGLTGRPDELTAVGIRAHLEAIRHGETEIAIRVAASLAMALMQQGDMAQGGGWLARAARLVEQTGYDGSQRGRLLIPEGLRSLMSRDPASALATFEQVAAIAERFADDDLAAFGRLGRGQALIDLGEVERGMALLDETMASVIADEVSPVTSGIVYCAVIESCHALFDIRRAGEWTAALTGWLDRQPDLVPFRGNCLIYRAELLRLHGAWRQASAEASRARELMLQPPPQPGAGEAAYQLAELDRLSGAFEAADAGYREAGAHGRLPEPGHALLRLAQGDAAAAGAAIRRAEAEAANDHERARYHEPAVEIALAAGEIGAARETADRLARTAEDIDAALLRAMALRADGSVRLAEGDVEGALGVLRRAWEAWVALDAPYEAARVRALTARACLALGDLDGAALELVAARETFEGLGAKPELARLAELARRMDEGAEARGQAGLSRRELEVLRLVAAGHTNRAIAERLTISERTVDRHVSNIFAKLDVSTRAAATAFAYAHGLV